ncbi:MAG: Ig-like domain-containing protein [Desulfococcaceae bacterium]
MKNTLLKQVAVFWLLSGWILLFPTFSFAEDGICARVKIEIRQEMTLERQAFDAHMRINNGFGNIFLDDVSVDVLFSDENGNSIIASSDPDDTQALFFIRIDSMEGIEAVDGNGTILPDSSADIHWLIIPAPGASNGLEAGTLYYVGATLSYYINGKQEEIKVSPDYIYVKPMPELTLDYFIPEDVYGDDAFTAEIETPVPFTLGVRVSNKGFGTAKNLKIQSAQPKIVENEQGLAIGFLIEGSEVNGNPAEPTLLADFGDILPNRAGIGRWSMTCTLSGKFVDFTADISHSDELGGELTSLVKGTPVTHFLIHDVLVDVTGRDSIKDFLAKPVSGDGCKVYESENMDTDVTDQSASSTLSGSGDTFTLSTSLNAGFVYVKLTDPANGTLTVKEVVRADGKKLPADNAWFSKTRDADNNWLYYFNLFDVSSTGSYTVIFQNSQQGPQPPNLGFIPDRSKPEDQQLGFLVTASDPNGTVPVLTCSALPAGAQFTDQGNGTGMFSWTPLPGQSGKYVITFTASDGQLQSAQTCTITITGLDSDTDGMPDSWEIKYFGMLDRGGSDDFDKDGISDLNEYLHETDPTMMQGDVNGDKEIDLKDAILALQVSTGISPDAVLKKEADINGDKRIGVEEAVFALQSISGSKNG